MGFWVPQEIENGEKGLWLVQRQTVRVGAFPAATRLRKLDHEWFGSNEQYLDLHNLHITQCQGSSGG